MVREIIKSGDKRLFWSSIEVEQGEDLTELIQDLHDTLMDYKEKHHAGRAIAAPQIDVRKKVIYMYVDKPVVFINPVLTFPDDEKIQVIDDCMSFPNLLVKLERYKRCHISYQTLEWKKQEMDLEGDFSELLQHEYDHLKGIPFTLRAIDSRCLIWKQKKSFYFKS